MTTMVVRNPLRRIECMTRIRTIDLGAVSDGMMYEIVCFSIQA